MLIHFRCRSCGSMLVARSDLVGQYLPCMACRDHTAVPEPEPSEEAPASESGPIVTATTDSSHALRQLEDDARRIAWVEAREAGRARALGVVLVLLGCAPLCFGAAALAGNSTFGVPLYALGASVGFGALSAGLGLCVVRLATEQMQAEFRRRLPIAIERLREEYWRTHDGSHQTTAKPTRRPAGALTPPRVGT